MLMASRNSAYNTPTNVESPGNDNRVDINS